MESKNLKKYVSSYKDIPTNFQERLINFIQNIRFTNKEQEKISNLIDKCMKRKTKTLKLVFYIIPEATPRPRLSSISGRFYVKNAKSNNDFVRLLAKEENIPLIKTPCKFRCSTYSPVPSNMNTMEKIMSELGFYRPVTTPDWDNYGKTYSDMVQKYILLNDSLIIEGTVKKYYSVKPRVEIEIEYFLDYDCKFNERKIKSSKAYKELK